MPAGLPELIAIDHDDYQARHVGRTMDGRQFFLTTPFGGHEYVALFLFDSRGKFLEAKIEDFGPRESMDLKKRNQTRDSMLQELGDVSFERIEVAPFSVQKFDTTFGLIPLAPDGENDRWFVELHPGNYMAFHEPWDSGSYDT